VKLLLHSCCAPCSTVALEQLVEEGHEITVFYCNPNIFPEDEYTKRLREQHRLLVEFSFVWASHRATRPAIELMTSDYNHADFVAAVQGLEEEPEGGERCRKCFALRLRETARTAKQLGFDALTTTITTGPRKSAEDVNAIGEDAAAEFGVAWLAQDFKKKDGYKRSIDLSKQFDLYRQSYCGCEFSMRKDNQQ
jgi:predicted adenine nucleotide alpha hydrolase (AANH) superfamily ATPase